MALLVLEKIRKSFAGVPVLDGAELKVHPGEKVGLVGPNGCGKTTLLRIAAGVLSPDDGRRKAPAAGAVGYLEQEHRFEEGSTVLHAALHAQGEVEELECTLTGLQEELEAATGDPEKLRRLVRRHAAVEERFRLLGGYSRRGKVERILRGLGFGEEDFTRPPATLSGGEVKRLQLACVLLGGFSLICLDEPGNHLDMAGREWLTEHLKSEPGAVLVVSHDRYLLNDAVDRIVELDRGRTRSYRGGYDRFLEERNRLEEASEKAKAEAERVRAKTEEFIRRNFYGQKARQAKSKRKLLDRLGPVERVLPVRRARFRFQEAPPLGDRVLNLEGVAAEAGGRTLLRDLRLELESGERVGVIGPNGCGKSTLLRIMAGLRPPDAGRVQIAPAVRIGYLDQNLEVLEGNGSLLALLGKDHPKLTEGEIRTHLGRFHFRGEEAERNVSELSGGERSRAALARVALRPTNLLFLDEPTNHLDIYMRESVEEALRAYGGTLVLVSHDRRLLDGTVNRLVVLGTERARVEGGNYSAYVARRLEKAKAEKEGRKKGTCRKGKGREKPPRRPSRRRSLEELEALILAREERLEEIHVESCREEVYMDPPRIRKLDEEARRLREELESLYREWEAQA